MKLQYNNNNRTIIIIQSMHKNNTVNFKYPSGKVLIKWNRKRTIQCDVRLFSNFCKQMSKELVTL